MEVENIMKTVEDYLKKDKSIALNKNLNILMNHIKAMIEDMKSPIIVQQNDQLSIVIRGESKLPQPGTPYSMNDKVLPKEAGIKIYLDFINHTVRLDSFTLDSLTNVDTVGVSNREEKYNLNNGGLIVDSCWYQNTFRSNYSKLLITNAKTVESYDELGIQYIKEETLYSSHRDNITDFSAAFTKYFVVNRDDNMEYRLRLSRKDYWNISANFEGKSEYFPEGTKEYMINGEHGFANLYVGVPIDSIDEEEKKKLIKLGIKATEDEQIKSKLMGIYNTLYPDEIVVSRGIH